MSLRAAILGFLSLEPTTGYTLRQRFEGSVGSFWTVTQSQIYRELHALEREGLVVMRTEPGDGRPDRKVYRLSKAGQAALQTWLREPLEPQQLRHPLLLKLVFSADVEPERLDALLADYQHSLAATRDEYLARLDSPQIFSLARSGREATLWRLAIEHGIAWCENEMAWIDRARRALRPPPTAKRSRRRTS